MQLALALAAFAGIVYMAAQDPEATPAPRKKRKKRAKSKAKKLNSTKPPSVLSEPASPLREPQVSPPGPASPVPRSESHELAGPTSLTPDPTS